MRQGYAKAERRALTEKARKAGAKAKGITGLRAEWAGGDMAGVKAPQDMCRSGLEG